MADSRQDLSNVAGPESMAKPESSTAAGLSQTKTEPAGQTQPKKKKHRGGRKRKAKQQSFNALSEGRMEPTGAERIDDPPRPSQAQTPFYRVRNHSNTSLESEALLDHREHTPLRPRRQSLQQGGFTRPSLPFARHRGSTTSGANAGSARPRMTQATGAAVIDEDEDERPMTDRTPLLSSRRNRSRPEISRNSSAHYGSNYRNRRSSDNSKTSSRRRADFASYVYPTVEDDDYDVNNPPSVPASPQLGSLDDLMVNELSNSPDRGRDAIINIDNDNDGYADESPDALRRRGTIADLAERDVCFPGDIGDISELGEEDRQSVLDSERLERRRTRQRQWPDLSILEDWSREEKEERTHQEHVRSKKINEPVMVGGRLRPVKTTTWHREEEDAPFRFTYFNETFDGTIHASTISDLVQEGITFRDLFLPDPIELHDSSDEEEDEDALERPVVSQHPSVHALNGRVLGGQQFKQTSTVSEAGDVRSVTGSKNPTRSNTPSGQNSHAVTPKPGERPKRYGPRPTFWLDVLQPTEMEMKVLAKAFGIHQLTTEDILMGEQREKVELFQSYYFLNYRSFEQDKESDDYMDPVNFYVVVFRDGVITFHHSQTPHPANVRRRIRQLNDYMSPTADWISYAIIDDVTDVYGPRVSQIEEEVDEIDEEILYLHVTSADTAEGLSAEKTKPAPPKPKSDRTWYWPFGPNNEDEEGDKTAGVSGGDMLRRVGECRKKVMSLYRLLGNKADVIKGFAKRCNENWEVAPRSEIGLYLGDIQDHIVTMNNNLSHYEK